MPLSMIATSTVRCGALPASSSRIARSTPMPGMWSVDSSRSCQSRGGSATVTAGAVTGVVAEGAGVGADVVDVGAGVGAGVVATVAGAPHAATMKAVNSRRELDGLMTDPGLRNIRRTITAARNGGQPVYAILTRTLNARCWTRTKRPWSPQRGDTRRNDSVLVC